MADNVHPSDDPLVATDQIGGVDYQRVKLTDPTDGSEDPIGVDANPMVTQARMAFVDWDDSIVPVTDNADSHFLPVAVRGTPTVAVSTFNATVAVHADVGTDPVTGPSNGTWVTGYDASASPGMILLDVLSTGGTPTIAAFGASTDGTSGVSDYDQQLPLVVPDGDSLVLAETFTPGVGARFCYILAHPRRMEIRALSGGTSDPVEAGLTFSSFQPPIVATVSSGGASGDTELTTKDYDSGGGTDTQAVVGILLPKSGGAVAGGTSSDPLRTDPTGTTAQPVTDNGGSLTVDNGGTFAVQADTELTTADLDTGAGTDTRAVVGLVGSKSGGGVLIPGDATKGLAVDLTATGANATALKVDGSAVTQPVSGTVTATGVAGAAATDAAVSGNPLLSGARASTAAPTAMSADGDAVPLWADRRGALQTVPGAAGAAAISHVDDQASSASLLGSNTSRRGVIMHNNSSAVLYVKYGTTASIAADGYSVKIAADGTWEMPQPVYQGAIDGIWSVNGSGYVNITELT